MGLGHLPTQFIFLEEFVWIQKIDLHAKLLCCNVPQCESEALHTSFGPFGWFWTIKCCRFEVSFDGAHHGQSVMGPTNCLILLMRKSQPRVIAWLLTLCVSVFVQMPMFEHTTTQCGACVSSQSHCLTLFSHSGSRTITKKMQKSPKRRKVTKKDANGSLNCSHTSHHKGMQSLCNNGHNPLKF